MKQSLLFAVAAFLFFGAAGLSVWNDGAATIKTYAGLAIGASMTLLAIQARRAGK